MKYDEIIMNQPNLKEKIRENLIETMEEKEKQLQSRYLLFFEVFNPTKIELAYRSKLVKYDTDGNTTTIMIANQSVFEANCIERCIASEPASNYFTTQDFILIPKEMNKVSLKWKTRKPLQQFHKDQLAYVKNPTKRLILNRDKGRR